jgi:calcium-dependent protein kinase
MFRKELTAKSDIWNCGVIMHILLSGYPPFSGKFDEEIVEKARLGKFSLKAVEWKNVSNEGKNLIIKMLKPEASYRYTAS